MEFRTYGAISPSNEPLLNTRNKRNSVVVVNSKLLGIEKPSFYYTSYVLIYIVFLCLGAVVFSFLETSTEITARIHLENKIENFKKLNPNVSEESLEELMQEVVKATKKGISVGFNQTDEFNWSFGQSLFFTSCVVTTIGYGRITPLTRIGKIFCILYALVGIPLTLILLSGLVERFLVPAWWLLNWLNLKLEDLYNSFNIRLLHLAIIITLLTIFFLVLPAGAFYYLEEDWSYLDALYYCFISLTTIGLGDYIAGDSSVISPYKSLYKIVTTIYLFLGITIMMLTLTIFYDIPQLNLGLLFSLSEHVLARKESTVLSISGRNRANI
ncbi:potassium channel subfamily K member 6-like isoform X1 [Sitophilus oryzae]|uniref:Potassium channel subfamily K member 6-like isoform X1 n=1 Tax=Sitophilus oryzae TaxID=7048 RepID=A0A6J2YGJ7_SITOR|nr:potassium channel subfamily K member 6-like isoform X1 [Sitophilus oryzae]